MLKRASRTERWRAAALLATGIAAGTLVAATPVAGHVGGTVGHLWAQHIRPKADARYFTQAAADKRFVNRGETASNSDKLDGVDATGFLPVDGTAANSTLLEGIPSTSFIQAGSGAGGDLIGSYPSPTVRANAIGSDKVQPNSLTGQDIDESTLGSVPAATNADSVDGQSATTFNLKSAGPSPKTALVQIGGLKMYAQCIGVSPGTDEVWFHASTDTDNSFIWSSLDGIPANGDWDIADGNPDNSTDRWFASNNDRVAVIVYRRGDTAATNAASVVTVNVAWRLTSSTCEVVGSAIGH